MVLTHSQNFTIVNSSGGDGGDGDHSEEGEELLDEDGLPLLEDQHPSESSDLLTERKRLNGKPKSKVAIYLIFIILFLSKNLAWVS